MTAERIRKYRERKKAMEVLQKEMTMEYLWATLLQFQAYPFRTTKNLKFTYSIWDVSGQAICIRCLYGWV